jgi:hypothetical protein
MGLDATVMCTCFAEGRSSPSPFPELVSLDAEGYVSLNLPYAGHEEHHDLFDAWMKRCCDHPDMDYAAEHISNWPGISLFKQVLAFAGWEHFPTLQAELPDTNGGSTSAAAAAKALQEVAYFRSQANLGTNHFLINTETGSLIYEHIAAYKGVLCWSGRGLNLRVDKRGFFITESEPSRELFRSMRFKQHLLEPELIEAPRNGKVEFVDLESGRHFICNDAVRETVAWPDGRWTDDRGRVCLHYPRRMHVETRRIDAARFSFLLDPLTRIFEAAVATGNPVRWG